jgi:hypothetical protein
MLCAKCLDIQLADGIGHELTSQLYESLHMLRQTARAGCEGCAFFEYTIDRAYQLYSLSDYCPPPPPEDNIVEIKSSTDAIGRFDEIQVHVQNSHWNPALEAFQIPGKVLWNNQMLRN